MGLVHLVGFMVANSCNGLLHQLEYQRCMDSVHLIDPGSYHQGCMGLVHLIGFVIASNNTWSVMHWSRQSHIGA